MAANINGPEAPVIPAWLEQSRLEDEYAAQAYESVPAPLRSRLKTALALYFYLYGKQDGPCEWSGSSPSAGFSLSRSNRPAPWALVVLSPEQRAPARLLAGLVPAILAGVETILVLCPDRPPSRRNCLALELAGIEHIFVPSAELFADPCRFFRALASPEAGSAGTGRLLLFPAEQEASSACWRHWKASAAHAGIPVWEDRPGPLLRVEAAPGPGSLSVADTINILAWCHGDARISSGPGTDDSMPAACYPAASGRAAFFHPECPLSLGPGLEGAWTHPELGPSFFRQTRLILTAGV